MAKILHHITIILQHQDTEVDQDSVDHAQDITATQEDRSIVDQDTPSNDQDGTTISSGYRRRRRVPQVSHTHTALCTITGELANIV